MGFGDGIEPRDAAAELVRARAEVGEFELTVCTDGTYKLDGGAMFGVVPKPLWEKRAAADDQNRILLGLNTVVVRTGKQTVLIETGIGNKQPAKMREIHYNQELLPQSLAAAGIRASALFPAKITFGFALRRLAESLSGSQGGKPCPASGRSVRSR